MPPRKEGHSLDPSPEVSVVIPTYRRPTQVTEAARSALAQAGVAVEVLVLDDSPEGSARAGIEALRDPRVTYRHRSTPSGGNPSLVRNEGLAETRAPVVHFLDDDDLAEPGHYADVLRALARHPRAGVVLGRIEPFGELASAVERERAVFAVSQRRARRLHRAGRLGIVAAQLFTSPTLFVNSACMVRREVATAVGGYDTELRVMEDVDFYTRAIRAAGLVFLDRVAVRYRTGYHSLMNAAREQEVTAAYARMYARYRAAHGSLELLGLKALAKSVIKWT